MEQKRVSFKIAKAIKEAGYPQELPPTPVWYYYHDGSLRYGALDSDDKCEAPYVMSVWLWLWREKKINVTPEYDQISGLFSSCGVSEREDPEEAIIAAIDYLVDNNLLK